MIFYTYILRSLSTGRFYVGHTENLTKRVYEHNNNRTPSIRNRGPWELVHAEEFETRLGAMRRELQIKKMKSHKWIERLARASLTRGSNTRCN
jgi:putative endonuclease